MYDVGESPRCELLKLLNNLYHWQKKHGVELESTPQELINEIDDITVSEFGVNFDYDSFIEKVCFEGVDPVVWLRSAVPDLTV